MKQKFIDVTPEDGEKIVLDRSAFKALASDTRVSILKELDIRRKTLSELSSQLNLSVATIKEHLLQLVDAKLIKQKDEGRKWKYYDLTEKGRCVLYPERKKIWVLLASLLFVISLSVFLSDGSIFGTNQLNQLLRGVGEQSVSKSLPAVESLHSESLERSMGLQNGDDTSELMDGEEPLDDYSVEGANESNTLSESVKTTSEASSTIHTKNKFALVVLFVISFSIGMMLLLQIIIFHQRRKFAKRMYAEQKNKKQNKLNKQKNK